MEEGRRRWRKSGQEGERLVRHEIHRREKERVEKKKGVWEKKKKKYKEKSCDSPNLEAKFKSVKSLRGEGGRARARRSGAQAQTSKAGSMKNKKKV